MSTPPSSTYRIVLQHDAADQRQLGADGDMCLASACQPARAGLFHVSSHRCTHGGIVDFLRVAAYEAALTAEAMRADVRGQKKVVALRHVYFHDRVMRWMSVGNISDDRAYTTENEIWRYLLPPARLA